MAVLTLKAFIGRHKVPLLALIIVHGIFFFLSVAVFKRPYSFDSAEYIQLATNISKGFYYSGNAFLPVKEQLVSLRPPVYSLFLLSIWSLFGYQTWVVLLFQNIISIFNCVLIYHTFDTLFPDTRYSRLYWLLVLCFPMQMVFANMVFADVLFQFFLMLYIRQLLFFLSDLKLRRTLGMSCWLILGVFTKPILFPLLVLHAAFVLYQSIKFRKGALVGYALLPLLLISLYGLWNKKQTGVFHISSLQTINMLDYNLWEFYLYKYGPKEAKARLDAIHSEIDTLPTFKEKYERSAAISGTKIKEELFSYSCFHIIKGLQMFVDPNKLEFDIFSREFKYVNNNKSSVMDEWRKERFAGVWKYLKGYPYFLFLLFMPVFGLIRLIGFFMFLVNKRNSRNIRIAVTLFVLYFVAITGPVANARYFLPIVLVVSACSWIGYARLFSNRKTRLSPANGPE